MLKSTEGYEVSLSASTLNGWLDAVQASLTGDLIVIIDSPRPGASWRLWPTRAGWSSPDHRPASGPGTWTAERSPFPGTFGTRSLTAGSSWRRLIPQMIHLEPTGDDRLGVEDALFLLQRVSGVR